MELQLEVFVLFVLLFEICSFSAFWVRKASTVVHCSILMLAPSTIALFALCFLNAISARDSSSSSSSSVLTKSSLESSADSSSSLVMDMITSSASLSVNESSKINKEEDDECELFDLKKHWLGIKLANIVLDLTSELELIQNISNQLKKIHLNFPSIPLSFKRRILGKKYEMQVFSGAISFHGIGDLKIKPIRALSSKRVQFQVEIPKLSAQTTCYINMTSNDSSSDDDLQYEAEVEYSIHSPSITIEADIQMYRCHGRFFTWLSCIGKSTWSYIKAFGTLRLASEFLGRFEDIRIHQVKIDFDDSKFKFHLGKKKMPREMQSLYKYERNWKKWHENLAKEMSETATKAVTDVVARWSDSFHGRCYR